ncbi:ABC transporter substrate-binding protein [Citricoccus sp.]|uniref:ABC transporter substrate-binding protein n=1 Tax=Citricoccus sp. TaxID=1978372 RepID=UPI00261AB439|nr:ABC transporter substrate-binding protein [Citricoccus sp.]HRO30344.1 ABC transporter substrate-binding protein [Citricoccus sp.]
MSTPPSPSAPGLRTTPRTPRLPGPRTTGLAVLTAATLVLSACSAGPGTGRGAGTDPDAGPDQAALTGAAGAGPVQGGVIEYGHLQEPNCIFGGWIQENFTARQVLDNLVSHTEDGSVVPWIATGWEVSEDGRAWTLRLREDVTFTDGTALDAEAVAYNFDYWLDGGNGTAAAHLGGFYDHSEVLDEHTVRIHLSAPFSPFLSTISQSYFGLQSPTALQSRTDEENCTEPIGSGPFTVKDWKRGEYIEFERNDDYDWAPQNARHQGPAHVAGIRWNIVPDNTSRYGSLLSGEMDAIGEVPAVNIAQAREDYDFTQYITPGRPVVMSLNTQRGIFTDQQVRQALSFATDREANVASAFLGTVPFEPSGYLSQTTPDYDEDAAAEYPFDLHRANELLDQAGWTGRDPDGTRTKDGRRLQALVVYGLNSIITPDGNTVIQNFQEQARAAGFDLVLRPGTPSEFFGGAFSTPESYDAQVGYWTSPHAGILNINYRPSTEEAPNGANTTFLDESRVFATIQSALQAPTPEEVTERFSQAQHELSELAPAIGLYTQTNTLAVGGDVTGLWLDPAQGGPVFHDAHFTSQDARDASGTLTPDTADIPDTADSADAPVENED